MTQSHDHARKVESYVQRQLAQEQLKLNMSKIYNEKFRHSTKKIRYTKYPWVAGLPVHSNKICSAQHDEA